MKAIEFTAREKNGTIALPEQYIGLLHDAVRVIILIDDEIKLKPQKIVPLRDPQKVRSVNFKAAKINTKKLKFTREEANAR